jgi:AhpD family alkylhydroperoxidase
LIVKAVRQRRTNSKQVFQSNLGGQVMNSTNLPATTSFPDQLQRIKGNMAILGKSQPATMKAFSDLHHAVATPGALDFKTKELIALAIGVSLRCDGCIAFHTHDALQAAATPEEVAEALGVAVLMCGGPSVIYATHVVEAVEQFMNREG